MPYSVTGMTTTPDIGFRSETRHSAQGAKDLATAYMVAGMQEIEVRDGRGQLRSMRELDEIADVMSLIERAVA